ncbi:MAG: hypothetical protein K1X82_14590, partial [Bacteroidia bacterium]|nr:hypothetical protein [Bacteroidia bacterium]
MNKPFLNSPGILSSFELQSNVWVGDRVGIEASSSINAAFSGVDGLQPLVLHYQFLIKLIMVILYFLFATFSFVNNQ